MTLKKGMKIVFAGDSVTDMGSVNPVGEGPGNLGGSYVRIIGNMLYSWYPELNNRITNSIYKTTGFNYHCQKHIFGNTEFNLNLYFRSLFIIKD